MDGITRGQIASLQVRALRKGVYYRVLNRLQRGLLYCAMRGVDTVKSGSKLWQMIVMFLEKLENAMASRINELVELGRHAAVRYSELAFGWGDRLAIEWRYDRAFQLALGVGALLPLIVRDA